MKNILFISYWSLREPLNAAAVFPYLRLLSEREDVAKIFFVTMETTRDFLPEADLKIDKVIHQSIAPDLNWSYLTSKVLLQLRSLIFLRRLVRREKIDLIFAKASMAGAIAHGLHKLTEIPYIVESYEPHSVYMLECGVWGRNDPRYLFAHHMEEAQLKHAKNIITVTYNHRDDLVAAGHSPERIKMIPSITDIDAFGFREEDRERVRKELGISGHGVTGIYVGKFGGLYYDREAFEIFARAFKHFRDLHIIVLSATDPAGIRQNAALAGIPPERFHLLMAPHMEVPAYLSASDFAFSTIKPSPIKRYQCPIKNGEYWANGLPIIMSDGIADDHKLMRQGIGGSVFSKDFSDLDQAFARIAKILADPRHKEAIVELARRYKSLDIARKVYEEILWSTGKPGARQKAAAGRST